MNRSRSLLIGVIFCLSYVGCDVFYIFYCADKMETASTQAYPKNNQISDPGGSNISTISTSLLNNEKTLSFVQK